MGNITPGFNTHGAPRTTHATNPKPRHIILHRQTNAAFATINVRSHHAVPTALANWATSPAHLRSKAEARLVTASIRLYAVAPTENARTASRNMSTITPPRLTPRGGLGTTPATYAKTRDFSWHHYNQCCTRDTPTCGFKNAVPTPSTNWTTSLHASAATRTRTRGGKVRHCLCTPAQVL